MWDDFKDFWAQQHFEDALAAQWTMDAIRRYDQCGPERREIERWARDEFDLSYFASEIADKTMDEANGCTLPKQWRRAYAKLIGPSDQPELPIFGRIFQVKVLALLADEAACCAQTSVGSEQVKERDTAVGRSPIRRIRPIAAQRADSHLPDCNPAGALASDDAMGS